MGDALYGHDGNHHAGDEIRWGKPELGHAVDKERRGDRTGRARVPGIVTDAVTDVNEQGSKKTAGKSRTVYPAGSKERSCRSIGG